MYTVCDSGIHEGYEYDANGIRKIKVNQKNFLDIKQEAANVVTVEPVREEPVVTELPKTEIPVEPEMPVESEINTFASIPEDKEIKKDPELTLSDVYGSGRNSDYGIDDKSINDRLEGLGLGVNYGSFIKGDSKKPKKIPVPMPKEREKISEKEFQVLLDTPVVIMKDEMEMYRAVFTKNLRDTEEQKDRDAKLTEAYKKITAEEQIAKDDYEFKKGRTKEMRNLKNFKCLEIGPNEDSRIVEPVQACDEALKVLLSTNLALCNELQATIEQYKNDKELLNRESDKVRANIAKLVDERSKFIEKYTPIIQKIIETNEQFKRTEEESKKAIRAEYEAISQSNKVIFNQPLPGEEVQMPGSEVEAQFQTMAPNMNNPFMSLKEE